MTHYDNLVNFERKKNFCFCQSRINGLALILKWQGFLSLRPLNIINAHLKNRFKKILSGSLVCVLQYLCVMNSPNSPLVRHLPTTWRPAWLLRHFDLTYFPFLCWIFLPIRYKQSIILICVFPPWPIKWIQNQMGVWRYPMQCEHLHTIVWEPFYRSWYRYLSV